eukprot:3494447-Amphidinium_carterae.1
MRLRGTHRFVWLGHGMCSKKGSGTLGPCEGDQVHGAKVKQTLSTVDLSASQLHTGICGQLLSRTWAIVRTLNQASSIASSGTCRPQKFDDPPDLSLGTKLVGRARPRTSFSDSLEIASESLAIVPGKNQTIYCTCFEEKDSSYGNWKYLHPAFRIRVANP